MGSMMSSGAITVVRDFIWKHGNFNELHAGDSWTDEDDIRHWGNSGCSDINNKGWICGWADKPGGIRAFISKRGHITYLPSSTASYGNALNNNGDVAGYIQISSYPDVKEACVWRNRHLIHLGNLWGLGSNSLPSIDGRQNGNTLEVFHIRQKQSSNALGINDRGQIIGTSDDNNGHPHACLWQDGRIIGIGTLGGAKSEARAINSKGSIVGYAENKRGNSVAVIWINRKICDLNSLLPKKSGWVLKDAVSINYRGQIVGSGSHNGKRRSYLLTPV